MDRTRKISASAILKATLLAGVLDILSAGLYAAIAGHNPVFVPVGIASAVWVGARHAPFAAIVVGLALHFCIMFVMVGAFAFASGRKPELAERPVLVGTVYGLVLYAVMYLIVLPLRWPSLFPNFAVAGVVEELFSHIALVGIPIVWVIGRSMSLPLKDGLAHA
ncbi:hypothetical protein [Dyella mobilis]|uniref:DUF1440 domain-containing protein n=1 Tax=Dyella mobilis TaxID=1849582 RepID=A0ABS2KC77_9GAMM|nr:hypothetical protein [Dyella mobilis]MBM7128769.1 hypothetical protein [Dyella mobilis]GLQ99100.1 hypothetical protein GCM10007863_35200 [Dyella mobilis]